MEFVRTIINSEELAGIIDVPESLKYRLVEILILPCEDKKKQIPVYKTSRRARGVLANYGNSDLIQTEDEAFQNAMVSKHEDS